MKPAKTLYERQKKLERNLAREPKIRIIVIAIFLVLLIAGSPFLYLWILHYLQR